MDSNLSNLVFLFTFFLAASILDSRAESFNQKRFLARIKKNSWGQIPPKEYTYEELEQDVSSSDSVKNGFYIDDITWNDLDMDRIFILINQSCSLCRAECLMIFGGNRFLRKKKVKGKAAAHRVFPQSSGRTGQKPQMLLASIRRP